MKMQTLMLGAAVLLAVGSAAAETIKLNTPENWGSKDLKPVQNGILSTTKKIEVCTKIFDVDPNKKYTLTAAVRAQKITGKDRATVYVGFIPYDKNGKVITALQEASIGGTFTTVTADAKKGDKTLLIKDGSKIKPCAWYGIVGNAKADFSDLPNRDLIAYGISKVEKAGENWKLTFSKPLSRDVKAGTAIREHSAGGYLYIPGPSNGVDEKWGSWKGSMKGIAKNSTWRSGIWPRGTCKAQAVLLLNYRDKKLETQIKDVMITIE